MAHNAKLRVLTWSAVGAVFLLMTLGNIVSATGSGLGCPDWPLCHGRLIPPLELDALIEYSHRLTAALATILVAATIISTIRTGSERGVRRAGIVLLVLLGVQIGLGGVTVVLKLPHLISTAHLVTALLILGGLLTLASRTGETGAPDPRAPAGRAAGRRGAGAPPSEASDPDIRAARRRGAGTPPSEASDPEIRAVGRRGAAGRDAARPGAGPPACEASKTNETPPSEASGPDIRAAGRRGAAAKQVARLARVGLAVLLLQLALGGYVRHTGAGLACPDFPLCSGELLPEHWLAVVHWGHRWLGVGLIGLFAHLAIASRGTALGGAAVITGALAFLQVVLGIAAVLLRLDPAIRAIHAAVGYALWAALVWVSARAGSWQGVLVETPGTPEQPPEVVHV